MSCLVCMREHKQFRSKWSRNLQRRSWSRVSLICHFKGFRLYLGDKPLGALTESYSQIHLSDWSQGGSPQQAGELRSWTDSSGGRKEAQIQVTGWKRSSTWKMAEWWKTGIKGGLTDGKTPTETEHAGAEAERPSREVGAFSILHIKLEVPIRDPGASTRRKRHTERPACGVRFDLE